MHLKISKRFTAS